MNYSRVKSQKTTHDRKRPVPIPNFGPVFLILLVVSRGHTNDEVFLKVDPGHSGRTKHVGLVLDFDAHSVRLKVSGDRTVEIDTKRVLKVKTRHLPSKTLADRYFANRQFQKAFAEYQKSSVPEKRAWVASEISAQMIYCLRAENKIVPATRTFIDYFRKRPTSRFLHCAPTCWAPVKLTREQEKLFVEMLAGNPLEQLIGASWLLSGSKREPAVGVLQSLAGSAEGNLLKIRVKRLANAQLWRTQIPQVKNNQLQEINQLVRDVSTHDRLGIYLIRAQVFKQLGQFDRAALDFLKIPILYPGNYQESAYALHHAARALAKNQDPANARLVMQELARDYTTTTLGKAAAKSLSNSTHE